MKIFFSQQNTELKKLKVKKNHGFLTKLSDIWEFYSTEPPNKPLQKDITILPGALLLNAKVSTS